MLQSLRLRNFRSYVDTDEVALSRLNVFIGPNNAGKSALLSAVELFLRSLRGLRVPGPLAFDEMPSFSSFASVVRRHWTPRQARPVDFALSYTWGVEGRRPFLFDFTCKGRPTDNVTYVEDASYRWGEGRSLRLRATDATSSPPEYAIEEDGRATTARHAIFRGPMPMVLGLDTADEDRVFLFNELVELEVVHPYRPVPRSFYVLDDPGLSGEDRRLLSFLIDVWEANGDSVTIKERILTSLKTLGLVTHLSIHQIGQRQGPKVVEISVAPRLKRHAVSIADVGFGLSQVLPLVAYDANLVSGYLVAYQPEVHLHPFAQSRLADLFAASVQRGNQVFVETHSPDLILRLQTLVARGDLSADAVRVFCLSNERGESRIVPVTFDRHGAPAIPWPPGFLDTSLSLARELCARRLENGRG